MRLRNLFTVRLPVEEAWKALLDLAGEHGERAGALRVKVGGVAVEYHGTVSLKDVDGAARRLVAYARGTEARDQSPASAMITATLAATNEGTSVALDTDLSVSGRLSPFGAGVIADVAGTLVKRFAATLEATAEREQPASAPPDLAGEVIVAARSDRGYWLPAALVGVLLAMAVTSRRSARWALAAAGVGVVVAGQRPRSPSST